ncbi:ComF family protein [Micromonospora echinofusca]|uniref:ComF family protein n=1 Tax=Micromonospora echinofusca TaxID=47858 RepID=UPI001AD633E9|nr:ComF family protein [Micromonospora echinofusca]
MLPAACAGCRAERVTLRYGFCPSCADVVQQIRPGPVRPDPAPPGLPPCFALGPYAGVLREALLSYKERGRHGLARPLGALLAEVVATAVGTPRPVLLVPVPTTAQAVRARHGDHLRRLCGYAADRLTRAGWPVAVARPLRALPRADSTTLDQAGRAAAALAAFRLRPGRLPALTRAGHGRTVVLLDDIVTTGATLAAVSGTLAAVGSRVDVAAVLAATERRQR